MRQFYIRPMQDVDSFSEYRIDGILRRKMNVSLEKQEMKSLISRTAKILSEWDKKSFEGETIITVLTGRITVSDDDTWGCRQIERSDPYNSVLGRVHVTLSKNGVKRFLEHLEDVLKSELDDGPTFMGVIELESTQ